MPGASVTSGMFSAAASMTTVVHVVRRSCGAMAVISAAKLQIDEQRLCPARG